jgi:predicted GH43/DUF377 family glycosyl hydrolase
MPEQDRQAGPAVAHHAMSHSDTGARRTVTATRLSHEPVVGPGAVPGYGAIFNAGVTVEAGVFHLFARGVREGYRRNDGPGPRFLDYRSDILVFTSADGISYDFQQVLAKGSDAGPYALEDPRVQRVRSNGSEEVVLSYTNLAAPESEEPWRIGVHRLGYADGRFHLNHTSGRVIGPAGLPDKDAVVFNLRDGRVALLHRIHPDIQLAVFDSLDELWDPPAGYWEEHLRDLDRHTIITPLDDALGVGAGAPPVPLDGDLLLFYHERDADQRYTLRVALLDADTGRAVSTLPAPILQPELEWERAGDVDEVVFVQGAVARADGTIYLTYGAADRCVGAASVVGAELVDALRAAA